MSDLLGMLLLEKEWRGISGSNCGQDSDGELEKVHCLSRWIVPVRLMVF